MNPIQNIKNPIELGRVEGKVEFNEVSFSYDENVPVIADMSFTVNPDMMVAIVGKSGSGKTTMMNLLLRFYENPVDMDIMVLVKATIYNPLPWFVIYHVLAFYRKIRIHWYTMLFTIYCKVCVIPDSNMQFIPEFDLHQNFLFVV